MGKYGRTENEAGVHINTLFAVGENMFNAVDEFCDYFALNNKGNTKVITVLSNLKEAARLAKAEMKLPKHRPKPATPAGTIDGRTVHSNKTDAQDATPADVEE